MISQEQAEEFALEFLMDDWEVPEDDRDWFAVKESRLISEGWYIVELEMPGYPDKWVIQVYDDGDCDPCYTFVSPVSASEATADLAELPESLVELLLHDRTQENLNAKAVKA